MSWIAFTLLLLALGWIGVGSFKGYIQDKKMTTDLPQGAGIIFSGLWFGLSIVLIYYDIVPMHYCWIFLPTVFVSYVAFLEDCDRVSSRTRLIAQVIAVYVSYYFIDLDIMNVNVLGYQVGALGLHKIPQWGVFSLIVLGILWMSQIMDRMDKMDGFVATHSLFVFGVGGLVLYSAGAYSLATLAFGLCSLIGGFAIWNWPVAKVVMGKSGTLFLGVVLSVLALYSYQLFNVPLEIWIILISPFLVDASLTVIRQMIARENFLEIMPNHAYQRLVQTGFSPVKLLCGLIMLDSVLASLVLWAYKEPELLSVITVASLGLVLIIYGLIEYKKPMYKSWNQILSAQCRGRTELDEVI